MTSCSEPGSPLNCTELHCVVQMIHSKFFHWLTVMHQLHSTQCIFNGHRTCTGNFEAECSLCNVTTVTCCELSVFCLKCVSCLKCGMWRLVPRGSFGHVIQGKFFSRFVISFALHKDAQWTVQRNFNSRTSLIMADRRKCNSFYYKEQSS